MRLIVVGLSIVAALAALPAAASPYVKSNGKIILYSPADGQSGGDVPTVSRGQQFGVNCGCVASFGNDEVRVVLNLAEPDQAPTGYRKLLATDQRVDHGALRVRVPNAPGLANHTVDVQVYVLEGKSAHACNAGKVRIT
jgi:hypothetical protein